MKTAILAGGRGTRLGDATRERPKALVEIGGRPIVWHIMSGFAHQGYSRFVVGLGYGGAAIKRYFIDYRLMAHDLTVDLASGDVAVRAPPQDGWIVDLVDTGPATASGGRIKRLAESVDGATFLVTWCDVLSDIDLDALVAFHRRHGRLATVVAVPRPSAFGHLALDGDAVRAYREKPEDTGEWIGGGVFVLEPGVFAYIPGDAAAWEAEPLGRLAADGQLMAYRHDSFWCSMETAADRARLEEMWASGAAPWRVWE